MTCVIVREDSTDPMYCLCQCFLVLAELSAAELTECVECVVGFACDVGYVGLNVMEVLSVCGWECGLVP